MSEVKWYRRIKTRVQADLALDDCWKQGYVFQGRKDGTNVFEVLPIDATIPRIHDDEMVEEIPGPEINTAMQPTPPNHIVKYTGMHWLKMRDNDSYSTDQLIALQWNPGSRTWSHSQAHDTAFGRVDATGFTYVQAILYPDQEK